MVSSVSIPSGVVDLLSSNMRGGILVLSMRQELWGEIMRSFAKGIVFGNYEHLFLLC